MRQRIIKRILVLSMVGAMSFALVACATTSSQDEPSKSQPTQEVETTPTPTPSEAPTPNEDEPSEPMPSQEPISSEPTPTPTQEPTPTPSEDTTTKEPQEPIKPQEPTPRQEPTQTPTPTPTTTTPPTSTPIHTHDFKGGDCITPSTCDCGEIGGYGDHNWATRHVDAYGYYEKGETHEVLIKKCGCGYQINSDMPNWVDVWESHTIECGARYSYWTEQVPNGEPKWIEVVPAHDETYCTICGAIQ